MLLVTVLLRDLRPFQEPRRNVPWQRGPWAPTFLLPSVGSVFCSFRCSNPTALVECVTPSCRDTGQPQTTPARLSRSAGRQGPQAESGFRTPKQVCAQPWAWHAADAQAVYMVTTGGHSNGGHVPRDVGVRGRAVPSPPPGPRPQHSLLVPTATPGNLHSNETPGGPRAASRGAWGTGVPGWTHESFCPDVPTTR